VYIKFNIAANRKFYGYEFTVLQQSLAHARFVAKIEKTKKPRLAAATGKQETGP